MRLNQIPNILTLFRLFLIPPFLFFLFNHCYHEAFIIFFTAGVTDGLDGFLARHFKWQSTFGSIVDPIADKLLIASSFISLGYLDVIPIWLVIIVFARDFTISVGVMAWYWVLRRPVKFTPTRLSKWNTTFQLGLVTICVFELSFFSLPFSIKSIFILVTALTTLLSYVDYVWTWSARAMSNDPHE